MSSAPQLIGKISLAERLLAAAVLCYAGIAFCLPVAPDEEIAAQYPWWANKIGIGNVQLHEVLFLLWLAVFGRRFVPRALLNAGVPARQSALLLVLLGLWCGIISLMAPLVLTDIGRTLRLLVNAALLLAVVRWTRRTGDMPLTTLIVGFLAGTIINLVFSFKYPLIVLNTMRLSGQNTPGVAMGVAIVLCAWLFLRNPRPIPRALAIAATAVFTFGCAISFSRIAWFAGGCGLLTWAYILFLARPPEKTQRRIMQKTRLVLVPVIVTGLVALFNSPLGEQGFEWISTLVEQKASVHEESDDTRFAYVLGTAEIVLRYPLGVGYSGFYDAMTDTDVYRSGVAAEEESPIMANPHAGLLWYMTAGGIPATLMAPLLLFLLLHSMRRGLVDAFGRSGWILFGLVALPYLVIASTVPYIFNSIILIVPAAITAAWGWTERAQAVTRVEAKATHADAAASTSPTI